MMPSAASASRKRLSPLLKRFRWQAIVALLVSIPVMVWGMMGDNMMVTADNRTLWLVIGLITLAVMVFAGGLFYTSATEEPQTAPRRWTRWSRSVPARRGCSMSVNVWPQWFPMEARHLYYENGAMIIGLINLGHMLEARASALVESAGKITRFNPADGPRGHGRRGKSVPLWRYSRE